MPSAGSAASAVGIGLATCAGGLLTHCVVVGDFHKCCHGCQLAIPSLLAQLVAEEMVLRAIYKCLDSSFVGDVGQRVSLLEPPCDVVVDGLLVPLYDVVEVGAAAWSLVCSFKVVEELILEVSPGVYGAVWEAVQPGACRAL